MPGATHVPLPASEMRILLAIYEARRALGSEEISLEASVPFRSIYTPLMKLGRRRLITSKIRTLPNPHSRTGVSKFGIYDLTADGHRLAANWTAFLFGVGPGLRRKIGW